ncbi:uncharacterized protein LOC111334581 [Stylophora pistillata]|uniref:uncharacterized protein LOC111334581 n=1 Tax=Stylophora pistillata TaxID=50429 RepID=UPI000C0522B9|nr:uncharacterized protein LOC111334581 [Stylophora pistillata]
MYHKGPCSTSVLCAALLLLSGNSILFLTCNIVRNTCQYFRAKTDEEVTWSGGDSIDVTNEIQHSFGGEGPANRYGSPLTGREGTSKVECLRDPCCILQFSGKQVFSISQEGFS